MARAPLAEVTAITDPLGYKIRGRWLHAAALQVADRGGTFPTTLDGLRALPGVGRYTAGALMSFAYRQDAPMLDTNIARLLARHFDGRTARAQRARLWQLAGEVIPKGKGYLINQALMDLGALICRARSPQCDICPVRRSCAFRRGRGLPSLRRRN
jgi:A/G-specific adenine glycosylase